MTPWAVEVVKAFRPSRPLKPLMAIAANNRTHPAAFVENRELFGDLADQPRFLNAYLEALKSLHERGARATLEALVASKGTL